MSIKNQLIVSSFNTNFLKGFEEIQNFIFEDIANFKLVVSTKQKSL